MDFFSLSSAFLGFICSSLLTAPIKWASSQQVITIRKIGLIQYGLALFFISYSVLFSINTSYLPAVILSLGLTAMLFFRKMIFATSMLFLLFLSATAWRLHIQTKAELKIWLTSFSASSNWLGLFFLLCATNIAFLYLWQLKTLKSKNLENLTAFIPAIETLKQILSVCLTIGCCFLSLSLILTTLGFIILHEPLFIQFFWAFLPWSWYSYLLFLQQKNTKTKAVALGSLLGVVFLFPAFFGFGFAY